MAKRRTITPIYPYDPLEEFRDEEPDKKPQKGNSSDSQTDRLPFVAVCLTVLVAIGTLVFSAVVFSNALDLMASRKEYTALSELAESLESVASVESDKPHKPYISTFDREMRNINPDYLFWITIDGTAIDYPVVRGNDNELYLSLSFYGNENRYGSLFMDYRCVGEYVPNIIIYGHNTKDGTMFGGLRKFLNEQYWAENPIITIKVNDRVVEYEIFSARKTDVTDPAYDLDFSVPGSFRAFVERCGAPLNTSQVITLSTCVSGNDKDERVIIQGFLR